MSSAFEQEEASSEAEPARSRSGLRIAGAAGSAAVLAGGSALGVLVGLAGPSGAATFTVTEATDDGTGTTLGTLSNAIAQANATGGADVIDFAPGLSTITFSGNADQVTITEALSITGPGADQLSVDFNENCGLRAELTGSLSVSGLTLTGGSATFDCYDSEDKGGALRVYGGDADSSLTISEVTFAENYAYYYGGGLACGGNFAVTVEDSTFSGNAANAKAGGAYLDCNLGVTISGSAFLNNTTGGDGGGVMARSNDDNNNVVVNSTFSGNYAGDGAGGGAYFENGAYTLINNSTFSNNSAETGGGIAGDVPVIITQSTFTSNSAVEAGGGVRWKQGPFDGGEFTNLTMIMSTVSGNTAPKGSELYIEKINPPHAYETLVTGSIVAGPGSSAIGGYLYAEVPLALIRFESSLVGSTEDVDVVDGGGNTFDVTDPGLEALADNGGPTETMALTAGSPAVDAGPDPVPDFPNNSYDQRGEPYLRVFGGQSDIGAYELQDAPEPTTTTTSPEPTTTTSSPEPTTTSSVPDPTTSSTTGGGSESASGGLPTTGASVAPLVAAGAALLASGGAASVLAARRRRGEHGLDDQD